jgi:hypothetical protein
MGFGDKGIDVNESIYAELENPCTPQYLDLKRKLCFVEQPVMFGPAMTSPSIIKDNLASQLHSNWEAKLPTPFPDDQRLMWDKSYLDSLQFTKTLVGRNELDRTPVKGQVISPLGYQLKMVVRDILKHNDMRLGDLYRGGANLTRHSPFLASPHTDHTFPHVGMLIYLNNCTGDTVICNERASDLSENEGGSESFVQLEDTTVGAKITPAENKVIIMDGSRYHYNLLPSKEEGGRMVIVATFSLRQ